MGSEVGIEAGGCVSRDDLDAISGVLCAHSLSLSCVISKCLMLSTYREEGFSLTHYLENSSPGLIDFVYGPVARPQTIAGECGRPKLLSTWVENIKESGGGVEGEVGLTITFESNSK